MCFRPESLASFAHMHTQATHSSLIWQTSLLPNQRSLLFYFFHAQDNCSIAVFKYTLCLYHKYPKYHPAHLPPSHWGTAFLVSIMTIIYKIFKQPTLLREIRYTTAFCRKPKYFQVSLHLRSIDKKKKNLKKKEHKRPSNILWIWREPNIFAW